MKAILLLITALFAANTAYSANNRATIMSCYMYGETAVEFGHKMSYLSSEEQQALHKIILKVYQKTVDGKPIPQPKISVLFRDANNNPVTGSWSRNSTTLHNVSLASAGSAVIAGYHPGRGVNNPGFIVVASPEGAELTYSTSASRNTPLTETRSLSCYHRRSPATEIDEDFTAANMNELRASDQIDLLQALGGRILWGYVRGGAGAVFGEDRLESVKAQLAAYLDRQSPRKGEQWEQSLHPDEYARNESVQENQHCGSVEIEKFIAIKDLSGTVVGAKVDLECQTVAFGRDRKIIARRVYIPLNAPSLGAVNFKHARIYIYSRYYGW